MMIVRVYVVHYLIVLFLVMKVLWYYLMWALINYSLVLDSGGCVDDSDSDSELQFQLTEHIDQLSDKK